MKNSFQKFASMAISKEGLKKIAGGTTCTCQYAGFSETGECAMDVQDCEAIGSDKYDDNGGKCDCK